jgi:hypothetical protein
MTDDEAHELRIVPVDRPGIEDDLSSEVLDLESRSRRGRVRSLHPVERGRRNLHPSRGSIPLDLCRFVQQRTTARIMGHPSIDEVSGEMPTPRERGGTDLPSVIARIGRKLAWRSAEAGPAVPPSKRTQGT